MDHAGVKKQLRIMGSELERFMDRFPRRFQLAVSVQVPGQDIVGVNIAPVVQFPPGQLQAFFRFHVVIGVKISELAVVESLIERVEPANVFDQCILLAGLFGLADSLVDLA